MRPITRRDLLGGTALLSPLLLSRGEAQVSPDLVRFRPEMEPLVALIEATPRERCAEMLVEQMKRGVSYRQFLAALFLAGIRNVNPRPPGFAMHCVFVIHSAHLLSLEAPPDSRLLPLFYALDNFKTAQDRDAKNQAGDYTMRALEGKLPDAERAASELQSAMETWDMERGERAVAALARRRSGENVFAMLWEFGARDYRNIGHKAIYAANASRTLHTIGWQHAEPVLRSLVLAMLDFGKQQRVNGYGMDDQCYAANLRRVKDSFGKLHAGWAEEKGDAGATNSIVAAIRNATPDEACADVTERMVKGSANAGAVWDAVHLASAELRMRARAGAALASVHGVTSANGLRHAFLAASDARTRFLLTLQAVGWMGQFRTASAARPENLRPFNITEMEPGGEVTPMSEIFAGIPGDLDAAAGRVFRMGKDLAARQSFFTAALRHTLAKSEEVHYYKYLAALLEDVPLVSPAWQPHMVASTVYYLKGAGDKDSATMKRAREAMRGWSGA
ncbi:MAG: hypothetical protein HYZ37_07755 [Candidatus Solibacter usitatus]|nr:hypothetical protein [Candidatus Solibacter usitatus]